MKTPKEPMVAVSKIRELLIKEKKSRSNPFVLRPLTNQLINNIKKFYD